MVVVARCHNWMLVGARCRSLFLIVNPVVRSSAAPCWVLFRGLFVGTTLSLLSPAQHCFARHGLADVHRYR